MKKMKTQRLDINTGDKEDNKASTYEKNNLGRTITAISGGRKDDVRTEAREKSSAPFQQPGKNSAGAVRNVGGAHHNKHREEKSQPFSLPEQLGTSMAESQASEEDDTVRSSIVSQILASVRGETCPSQSPSGLNASSSTDTGDRQHKKSSPPPVAARVHKSKPHSSTTNSVQAKPKQVMINAAMDVLNESQSTFSGDSTPLMADHPKPPKPPRSTTTNFVSEKVKSLNRSSSNDVQPASTLVNSDLGVHRTKTLKSEISSSTIVTPNAENSSHANVPSTKEPQTKRIPHMPHALASNPLNLSTSTCTSSINCEIKQRETQNLASQSLVLTKQIEARLLNDHSDKNGDKSNRSQLEAPGKAAGPTTCKSGGIIEPSTQSMCRGGEGNQPLSLTATSEFPQSLSADSGIGSPTTQTCAVERERGRGGLVLNTMPDQSALGPADGDTNQITSTPITSPDCLAPSGLNSDSNYLRNLEISPDVNTPRKTTDLNTPQTTSSSNIDVAVSDKQSDFTVSDTSRNKSPESEVPTFQTNEPSLRNSIETPVAEDVPALSLSQQLSSNSLHTSCEGEKNSKKTSASAHSVSATEGKNLEGIRDWENSAPSDENGTQNSSGDGRTSNGECGKQENEKTDVKLTNNNENVKKKNLLFVDQPEIFKPGFPGLSNKKKPSFKDVSLYDVLLMSSSPNSDRKIKGILKTSNSSPALVQGKGHVTTSPEPINGLGCPPGKLKKTISDSGAASRCVSFKNTHTKNTFSYHNAAFEGEIITEPSKRPSLADVVSHLMRQNSIVDVADDDNSHPYGRDSSLTDLVTGKRRDRYSINAGKLIVWLALAVMIVSLAAGIIFMSETYHLKHPEGSQPETPALYQG